VRAVWQVQRKGPEDGPEYFTALNLCLSKGWSKAAMQNLPRGNEGSSCLRTRKEKRKDRDNEEEEGKARNKGKRKKSQEE